MITFGVHPTPLYSHTFMYTAQRRARQTARIENERAMRQFCRSLSMGLGKDAVVVLGDKDVTKSRFYRPRPHKRLLRELSHHSNLVIVGEYYSSQKCAFCGRQKANSGDAWIGEGPGGKHGVRTCENCKPESSSAMYVHRDMNSARCIRDIHYGLLTVGSCCWNAMACISTTSYLTQTCTHIVIHRWKEALALSSPIGRALLQAPQAVVNVETLYGRGLPGPYAFLSTGCAL